MGDLHREALEEQFVDTALYFLMDEYAESEGKELLSRFKRNQQTIPENLDHACRKNINAYSRISEKSALLRRTGIRAAKIAAVLAVMISLSVNLILSVEAIRVPLLNFYLDSKRYFSSLSFNPSEDTDSDSQEISMPISAPKGYRIIKKSHNYRDYASLRSDSSLFLAYQNENGHILMINTYPAVGSVSLDTEDAQITEFELNGMDAISIQSDDGMLRTLWIDPKRQRSYDVSCNGLEEEAFDRYVFELSGMFLSPTFFTE